MDYTPEQRAVYLERRIAHAIDEGRFTLSMDYATQHNPCGCALSAAAFVEECSFVEVAFVRGQLVAKGSATEAELDQLETAFMGWPQDELNVVDASSPFWDLGCRLRERWQQASQAGATPSEEA